VQERHESSLAWLDRRIAAGVAFHELADEAVVHLRSGFPHYHWVGIYMVEGDRLRLRSWDGPAATQHVDIPLDQGVCGYAASTGALANVPDVSQDDRYLQCFLGTRAELVVPIRTPRRVFGEIDIDSDQLAAFTADDEAFLTSFCDRLGALAEREGRAGHVPG
jgi:L-methionine (R)-S-oxide reductase